MFIWLCDWRQIHLPLPWSQCRTATGTHFKRAGVTLTGLQACVRLFPSPQIKCCFSRLAVAQSLSVCLCVMCVYVCIWVWVVVFFMSGWKMAWGTSLPPCLIIKYEFRLFLYRELEWSLILRRAGYEFSSPRGNMRDYWARLVIFLFALRKQRLQEVWWKARVTLTFWMIWHKIVFLWDSTVVFSSSRIFRRTQRNEGRP